MGSHGRGDRGGRAYTCKYGEPINRAYGGTPTDTRGCPGRVRSFRVQLSDPQDPRHESHSHATAFSLVTR